MIFNKIEKRAEITLQQFLEERITDKDGDIDKSKALGIPSVSACVNLIANIVGSLKVKLYKETKGKTEEIIDYRTLLLNKRTGDTLNPTEFKKAMVIDYLLDKGGYAFINGNKSLNYVDCINISILKGIDPILKDFDISVNGQRYLPFQFLRLLRNTKDGSSGIGIVQESNEALSVAYRIQEFEKRQIKAGGNKSGFLKSKSKLSPDGLSDLRTRWKTLYNAGETNMMILNDGIDFVGVQATSVELQMNETKTINNAEICKLMEVPTGIFEGNITEEEFNSFIKTRIIPILIAFESCLNEGLLTEVEKEALITEHTNYYWQFETSELLKGSLVERYQAYQIAVLSGFMTKNEVRNKENLEDIEGLDIVTMNLADVIFDVKTKTYFTPNMNATNSLGSDKGIEPNPIKEKGDDTK
ncbi:phage portal protein [Clostridium gasigenes]|uniref:phage portal protein n=1 Tax=Clostridium gasigenes TaxID=94869 RepID=UPI001625A30F|nr:phage portal protein [Clostridium gasigenes]MBB6622562.1 phage portal protein [Clostridium gasigenes]